MSYIDCFAEEMITPVKITANGEMTGIDANGQPIYDTGVTKYDSLAGVWQLSSSQIFENDRINNPSTHQIVLFPDRILSQLKSSDTALITINGTEYTFDINVPDDIMGLGEVVQLTGNKRVTNE